MTRPLLPGWYLSGFLDPDHTQAVRVAVRQVPFVIGRAATAALLMESREISREHAVLDEVGGALTVRALGAGRGTWLNGQPLGAAEVRLEDGDLLQLADVALRVERRDRDALLPDAEATLQGFDGPGPWFTGGRQLRQVLAERTVQVAFQPIVALASGQVRAWEALGRVSVAGLPPRPDVLLAAADELGEASALSALLRSQAVTSAAALPSPRPTLFVNTHPGDLHRPGFAGEITALAAGHPDVDLVVEVHESCEVELATLQRLGQRLEAAGVGLAYDDFGAGSARLLALCEAPPRYLKFDRSLSGALHTASPALRGLVAQLVGLAHAQGVATIAEGVEDAAAAEAARAAGFELAQGYHFGRPGPPPVRPR